MTSIASVSQSAASAAATAANPATQGEDRFLKLLVAQLKNQDPLSPLDNAQLTSQMAQISTVSGIDKLNQTLSALSGQMTASQPLGAASLVGRQVMVAGNTLGLASGTASGGFALEQPVDDLTVTISDQAGIVMSRVNLGPHSAGTHAFGWDGKTDGGQQAVDGFYSFSVAAVAAGRPASVAPLSIGRVDGVRPDPGGTTLNLGGYGVVRLADLKQIF